MRAATCSAKSSFGETAPTLMPALSLAFGEESGARLSGRFRCLTGLSGQNYMFCAVSPVLALMYRDCVLAVPTAAQGLQVVSGIPADADEVFVHCLDGDTLADVKMDLRHLSS